MFKEADLQGHIENQASSSKKAQNTKVKQANQDIVKLLENDYQLSQAVTVLKAVAFYQKLINNPN